MKKLFAIALLLGMLLTACQSGDEAQGSTKKEAASQQQKEEKKEITKDEIDLNTKPNEAGQIMILMYHNISTPEAEWVRTPENFRKDLQALYDQGYLPISLTDYVNGNITAPAGKSPYVLTFDDGRENNFNYLEDGSINPDSAVGIIMEFAEKYDDFEPRATFFVNGTGRFGPKEEVQKKFDFLVENGMEVGNHTINHPNMKTLDASGVQREIGGQKAYLEESFSKPYNINTLALPFGSRPDKSLYNYLETGSYEGKDYKNIAILNVGWDPNPSPYHTDFDPLAIHRVRASETNVDDVGIYDWIEILKNHPKRRFVSDGAANIVTVPQGLEENVKAPEGKELLVY